MPESRGEAVLIATGGLIWMVKFFSPDSARFVTRTLKLEVPAAVGVPLMTPSGRQRQPRGQISLSVNEGPRVSRDYPSGSRQSLRILPCL